MVSRKRSDSSIRIRVSFSPADYPALCSVLERIPSGRRRARRLATLAHVGALFEQMRLSDEAMTRGFQEPANTPSSQRGGSGLNLTAEELADLAAWGS
jgi:hypothetical protein